MKLLSTYIEPIFLYNSETWTIIKSQENTIDAFQRTLMRKFVMKINWPRTISNENLYTQTNNPEAWSKTITRRRLNWFGKVVNLPDGAPAKKALKCGLAQYVRPPGRPKTTWVSRVKNDLSNMNFSWRDAEIIATENLSEWLKVVKVYINNL